ncbi:MAG TPA: histidine kinase dimerization/phospho-acceptor domain-containing protein, partial [Flavisolibacter sp.]|nr:histidine kinase dimerization/phospho-acceptor domain-containing protein [Flavisolibacter sp.]
MAISVKSKIRLGTFFLFLLMLLLGGAGIFFLMRLKSDAKAVLEDNYESLAYSLDMQKQLDSTSYNFNKSIYQFERDLQAQEHNITEQGENTATKILRSNFDKFKAGDTSVKTKELIRNQLNQILGLNLKAIQQKNTRALTTAEDALTFILITTSLVVIIALSFSFNFPQIVVGPIKELTEAIKEITNKNYSHRIHIKNKDEFGQLADAFNDMAGRLEYFENSNLNKLLFEKARAEAVINSLKDASFGINKQNQILFANSQALLLLGVTAQDIVGKMVAEIKAKNDLFRFLVDNEKAIPFKIVVDNKENYFIRETIDVLQGDTSSKVIVLKNITSFKELDVAKTNFIATISHELKTPLASSDLSIKLLQDDRIGMLSPEQKELVQNLKNDNGRMLKILSELLNMSQVEAGKIQLNIEEVDPESIINMAIEAVANTAKGKNIAINKDKADHLPRVNADAEKTVWVLTNFLINAIKYSPDKSTIKVGARKDGDKVIFYVTDEGTGIPSEYIEKVFERYFKVPG